MRVRMAMFDDWVAIVYGSKERESREGCYA